MTDTSTQATQPETMTYVCPIKDIVCGDRPENWCKTCPKRTMKLDTSTLVAERDAAVLALRELVLMARTTGGTAGPDPALMLACDRAETVLAARAAQEKKP